MPYEPDAIERIQARQENRLAERTVSTPPREIMRIFGMPSSNISQRFNPLLAHLLPLSQIQQLMQQPNANYMLKQLMGQF